MTKYARKRDIAEPSIVDALEKAGCVVYRHLPVDLLVCHPMFPVPRLLEVKTPTAKGTRPNRHDQAEQEQFCATTGTPYVLTPEDALRELGLVGFTGEGQ